MPKVIEESKFRECFRLFQKGKSSRFIGEVLGIDHKTVTKYIKINHDVRFPRKKIKVAKKEPEILKDYHYYIKKAGITLSTVR